MLARTLRITALAALVAATVTVGSLHAAGADFNRTQYLTFTRAVALPGVALNAGTYIFELPSPDASPDVVRVMSRDRKIVYFTAFTRAIARTAVVPGSQLVSLKEVPAGQPAPIAVWWSDARSGRQFLY
jgi:hypothetical protein